LLVVSYSSGRIRRVYVARFFLQLYIVHIREGLWVGGGGGKQEGGNLIFSNFHEIIFAGSGVSSVREYFFTISCRYLIHKLPYNTYFATHTCNMYLKYSLLT
jgi:hypothetical protein